jgi:hypothetical protein
LTRIFAKGEDDCLFVLDSTFHTRPDSRIAVKILLRHWEV